LNDEHREKVLTTLSEVYSRNAQTVVISDCYNQLKEHHSKIDFHIDIENCGLLTPLLSVVAFQRLTVEICQLLKRDPDYPRNLAKCVTTR
jgi:glucosamine--fructose-6-phosphate aminotransferase (isomerizing)